MFNAKFWLIVVIFAIATYTVVEVFIILDKQKYENMNDAILTYAKANITSKWIDIHQPITDITVEAAIVKKTETIDNNAHIYKAKVVLKGFYISPSGKDSDVFISESGDQVEFKVTKYFLLRQTATAGVYEVSLADAAGMIDM